MAVSLDKTTFYAKSKDGSRTKDYTSPKNVMKFGRKDMPSGEFALIKKTGDKETVLLTALKA